MVAADTFSTFEPGLDSPCKSAFAITPHDTNFFTNATRYVYVGSAGALAATMLDGTEVVFGAVAAGVILPIRCTRIKSTGTVASNLVGLY